MANGFKLNLAGFRQIRLSTSVDDFLRHEAEALARRCGPGYEAQRSPSHNRSRWVVIPVTEEAIHDNARNNTLVRNMK